MKIHSNLMYMKRLFILVAMLAAQVMVSAGQLVLIPTKSPDQAHRIMQIPSVKVHFYRDTFLIASIETGLKDDYVVLDNRAFLDESDYYLVYCPKDEQQVYLKSIEIDSKVLYANDDFIVLKYNTWHTEPLRPFHNDGMVRIMNTTVRFPTSFNPIFLRAFDPDTVVAAMLEEVSGTNLTTTVQHLQDYHTRNCYTPQSVEAQNWLAQQFTDLGFGVEIMDFPMSGSASDNVIATKVGTVYPDEYVICGSHYDSFSNNGDAPGADDNASGSAAVLEIARILSQYACDRTIIFCTFSGEEYGLYGSGAYASRCAEQGMNIQGYFNLDMIGYLQNGSSIHTDVIYPASAQELYDFYAAVCSTYLPEFIVEPGSLSGGDSDHTSFNDNGFMGIFPFEDSQNYSPYIHTSNDLVGPSYNNEDQSVVFTKATLASVVTMANRLNPPQNLVALSGDQVVALHWSPLPDASIFNIYRDDVLIDYSNANSYTDNAVVNGTQYSYYVTAIYTNSGEESAQSNVVNATPMPPLTLPFTFDFENGSSYWELNQRWGLSTEAAHSPTHSLTESPTGQYDNDELSQAVLRPFNLDFGYTSAQLSFWNKFNLESGYDYMYVELSTDGSNWTVLETFNGSQPNWQKKTYALNSYLGESFVQIRFRFTSDNYVTEEGMFIDDFAVTVEGGYQTQSFDFQEGWSGLSSYILPISTSFEDLFAPLGTTLLALQSMDGSYIPMDSINTLGSWDPVAGYKIKVADHASLQLIGTPNEAITAEVTEGWNLIPVLSQCDVTVADFLAVNPEIRILKEAAGSQVFWAEEGIYELVVLHPGKAYLVQSNLAATLTFPPCMTNRSIENIQLTETDYTPTGNSHIIVIPAGVADFTQVGDKIMAFNQVGLCVGSATIGVLTEPFSLVVFGEDSLSQIPVGMNDDEPFYLKWLDSATNYHDIIATYNAAYPNQNHYADQGLSKIESLVPDMVDIAENVEVIGIYPNPATNQITVMLQRKEHTKAMLATGDGRRVMELQNVEKQIVNISGLAKGVYAIILEDTEGTTLKKFVIR